MPEKINNRKLNRILRPSIYLLALNGIFIVLLFLKYVDYRYEDALYRTFVNGNKVEGNAKQTFINLVNLTYTVQIDRLNQVKNFQGMNPFKSRWMRSGDLQLLDANGSCGNFSHVLAELCQSAGFPVRMVQLKQNGKFGSHIVIEAYIDSTNEWAVADGLFKTYFFNEDSTLASMKEMQNASDFLKKQFPPNYPYNDAYADYRYTNWDKIPVIMPGVYKILTWTIGKEKTDQISLRVYLLNLHKAQFNVLLFVYFFVFVFTLKHLYYFIRHRF